MKLPESATAAGTERYRRRFEGRIPLEHFRHEHWAELSVAASFESISAVESSDACSATLTEFAWL